MSHSHSYSVALARDFVIVTTTICVVSSSSLAAAERGAEVDASLRAYHTGNGLLNRGLYDLAAREYRAFLEDHTDHEKAPVARYGLAVSLFRVEKYTEAVGELTQLPSDDNFPYAAETATMLGQCHLLLKAYEPAATAFQRVIDDFANHELADDAAAGAAEALYYAGEYDGAVEHAVLIASRWPDSPLRERAEYFRALALMSRQDYAAAADRFAALLARQPDGPFAQHATLLLAECHHHSGALADARRVYRRIVEGDSGPFLPDALYGLALILQNAGENSNAASLLNRLLERFPESPLAADARLLRARVRLDSGEIDRAQRTFDAIADEHEALRSEALYYAAKCRLRRGDHADAADLLERALEESPGGDLAAEMTFDRAVALLRRGDYQAAEDLFREFQAKFEPHVLAPDALRLQALAKHHLQAFDESGNLCTQFLETYPESPLATNVAFLAAENHFLSAGYDDAARSYEAFLNKYPESERRTKAEFRLGITFHRLQRFDEAQQLLLPFGRSEVPDQFRGALLALGDIAFQHEDWNQAKQHLMAYLNKGVDVPAADEALLKLGLAQYRIGLNAEALESFDRLLNRFPKSPHRLQALFERGQTLLAMGDLANAGGALEEVLAAGNSRFKSHALNHLGAIAMKTGRFDEAADRFSRVGSDDSGQNLKAPALLQQGQALVAAGKYAEAETALSRFIEEHPGDDGTQRGRAQLAIAVARQERFEDALELMKRCEADRLDPTLASALLYEKAWSLHQLKSDEESAKAYRQLLARKSVGPLRLHALLELAVIETEAGRHNAAAELLRRLHTLLDQPSADAPCDLREQAIYSLAVCEFELQNFEKAATLFGRLLDEFPDSGLTASAAYFCGEALFRADRHERAVPYLTRVVDDFPSDPAYPAALLRLGDSLSVLQRWARAERTFSRFLEQFPKSEQWFQAQFGLGWTRENQQRYAEAIAAYHKVVDKHEGPTAARAQFQIGECLFAKNEYEDAARELLKVDILYAYPEWSAAALYEAGRCFEKLAKHVEARQQFKQVTEKYADTNWGRLAAERLDANMNGSLPGR